MGPTPIHEKSATLRPEKGRSPPSVSGASRGGGAAANGAFGGSLIPVPGGVLVKDSKGRVLGALGVTGDSSDNDAAAAKAGVEAAGLVAAV